MFWRRTKSITAAGDEFTISRTFNLWPRHYTLRARACVCMCVFCLLTPNDRYSGRTAPLTSKRCILYIYSTIQVLNILNMVYTLRFFSSKFSLFHNSNVFGSCFIHILYTGVLKLKKNNSGAKRVSTGRIEPS